MALNAAEVFIGWDPNSDLAGEVCAASLRAFGCERTRFLVEKQLRCQGLYWRRYFTSHSGQMIDVKDSRPFSTQFAFTRFLVPHLSRGDYSIFVDADFMFRARIDQLLEDVDVEKTVSVVQQAYIASETTKMRGVSQWNYPRKNWSSLMIFNNEHARKKLSVDAVNEESGQFLHCFRWVEDAEIGKIDPRWNWLDGWSSKDVDPFAVHYTRGTPDMIGAEVAFAAEWISYARALKRL